MVVNGIGIDKLCENIRLDMYGGSAEMVEAAIKSFCDSINNREVSSVQEIVLAVEAEIDKVLAVTPTIAPMINLLHSYMSVAENVENCDLTVPKAMLKINQTLTDRLAQQNLALERIGSIGGELILAGSKVSTFSTSGTVMSIFSHAVEAGKSFEVTACEARPNNEGYRTLQEISDLGMAVTWGIDAILGSLIPGSSLCVIGADAITSCGETLAKVGSFLAALVCREYGVPFYIAADTSKFDPLTLEGFPIKERIRPPHEVSSGPVPEGSTIINPSFEMIPAHLITGIITEIGLIPPGAVSAFMKPDQLSQKLTKRLKAWMKEPTRL